MPDESKVIILTWSIQFSLQLKIRQVCILYLLKTCCHKEQKNIANTLLNFSTYSVGLVLQGCPACTKWFINIFPPPKKKDITSPNYVRATKRMAGPNIILALTGEIYIFLHMQQSVASSLRIYDRIRHTQPQRKWDSLSRGLLVIFILLFWLVGCVDDIITVLAEEHGCLDTIKVWMKNCLLIAYFIFFSLGLLFLTCTKIHRNF